MNVMMKLLFFFGARPEAIKLAPLIREFERSDIDLDIMRPGQSIYHIVASAMTGVREVIEASRPDALIVQGDTTTTFAGAIAAFCERVRVIHVEAGLRSFNKYSPFPEEMNLLLATHIADLHIARQIGLGKNPPGGYCARKNLCRGKHRNRCPFPVSQNARQKEAPAVRGIEKHRFPEKNNACDGASPGKFRHTLSEHLPRPKDPGPAR
jgi:hypothetical protein